MNIILKRVKLISTYFILLVLLSAPPLFAPPVISAKAPTVKIGVLALRGEENVLQKWPLTADYLSTMIPGQSFEIVPLSFPEVREAVQNQTIDFLITNSSYYVELEYEFGISRIATMENLFNHVPTPLFGGVIFTRSDRDDINELLDLRGKSFCAVDPKSFGGWLMALREFHSIGMVPEREFKALTFAGTHDDVVLAVTSGKVDAGTVRTDTLEKMAEEGTIQLAALKILNPQKHPDEIFHFLHSTRLYPEWPFAKLRHTDDQLSEEVAIALLRLPTQSPAAQILNIGGWTIPLDYQPIHELMQELEIGPYAHHFGKIRLSEIVEQHWRELLVLLVLSAVLLLVTSYTVQLNRKLVATQAELAKQLKTMEEAQQALQESEKNYRKIFHSANDAFFIHDANSGAILDVNKTMCEMYGYTYAEVQALSVKDLSADEQPSPDRDAVQMMAKALSEGPQTFTWLARRKNGECFWVEIHLKQTSISGQKRLLAVVHDIDDRKKAEEALQQYSQHLEKFVDERTADLKKSESALAEAQRIAHLGNWEWLSPGNEEYWSDETFRIFGFEPGKIVPTYDTFLSVIHPEDRDLVKRTFDESLQKNGTFNLEHRIVLADGSERMVYERAEVFRDGEGKQIKVTGIVQDITERMLLEQERTRLVKAVEYAAESIVITDRDGTIQYVNPSFTKVTGYDRDEIIGENPRILKSGQHDQAFYHTMWETLIRGQSWFGHFTNKKKDGTLFEEDAAISPIVDSSGNIVNYVAVKHDVSERIELEKQLRQAQKLECIGTLAGGIAHDFNNILAAIMGFATIVLDGLPKDSPWRASQQQVVIAGQRAVDLVRQILTFSRRGEQKLLPLQPQLVINEALRLLRATIPATITFKLKIDQECGSILADPTQIHQVVMNLCTNAYHAMREQKEGVLGVTLSSIQLEPESLQNKIDLQPGPYVRLEVSDTGQGMTAAVLERIFEPYFTTKEQGEGTGLGLSLVHGIVKGLSGGITVYSEVGVGTTFHLYFPRITTDTYQENLPESSLPGGKEHLLIVDDEATIVNLAQQHLESYGYRVTAAESSIDALQMFKENPDTFDLIVTDMNMPYMSGLEFATNILEIRKDMPIIICTGYSEIINEEKIKALGIREYLMKPISKDNLARAVRRVLG